MKNTIDQKLEITKSSGNVFADMGLPDADKHLAKAKLAYEINAIIKRKGLKQAAAAKVLGIDQPKISALSRGLLSGFSIERLIGFLNKLDRDVDITIKSKPTRRKSHGCLQVVFA